MSINVYLGSTGVGGAHTSGSWGTWDDSSGLPLWRATMPGSSLKLDRVAVSEFTKSNSSFSMPSACERIGPGTFIAIYRLQLLIGVLVLGTSLHSNTHCFAWVHMLTLPFTCNTIVAII